MTWQVFYPCATAVIQDKEYFLDVFLSRAPVVTAGMEHSTFGMMWQVFYLCATIVVQDKEYF